MGKETDEKNRGPGINYCFFGATDNNGLEKELSSRTQKGTNVEDICDRRDAFN